MARTGHGSIVSQEFSFARSKGQTFKSERLTPGVQFWGGSSIICQLGARECH